MAKFPDILNDPDGMLRAHKAQALSEALKLLVEYRLGKESHPIDDAAPNYHHTFIGYRGYNIFRHTHVLHKNGKYEIREQFTIVADLLTPSVVAFPARPSWFPDFETAKKAIDQWYDAALDVKAFARLFWEGDEECSLHP